MKRSNEKCNKQDYLFNQSINQSRVINVNAFSQCIVRRNSDIPLSTGSVRCWFRLQGKSVALNEHIIYLLLPMSVMLRDVFESTRPIARTFVPLVCRHRVMITGNCDKQSKDRTSLPLDDLVRAE